MHRRTARAPHTVALVELEDDEGVTVLAVRSPRERDFP
jgi:hypothetical protein